MNVPRNQRMFLDRGRRPSAVRSRASSRITKDQLRNQQGFFWIVVGAHPQSAAGRPAGSRKTICGISRVSFGSWSAPIRSQQPGVQQDHERPAAESAGFLLDRGRRPSAVSSRASSRITKDQLRNQRGFLLDRGRRPSAVSSRASSRITKDHLRNQQGFFWIVVGAHPQSAAGRPAGSRKTICGISRVSFGSWSAPIRSQQPGVQQNHERPSAESAEFLLDRGRRPSAASSRASSRITKDRAAESAGFLLDRGRRPIRSQQPGVQQDHERPAAESAGFLLDRGRRPIRSQQPGVQQDHERPSAESARVSFGSWSAPIRSQQPGVQQDHERPAAESAEFLLDRGRRPSAVSSRASSRITKDHLRNQQMFLLESVVGAHPQSAAGRPARSRKTHLRNPRNLRMISSA